MRRGAIGVAASLVLGSAGCTLSVGAEPICAQPQDAVMVLEAQSVPTATRLPCIAELPIGWRFGGMFVNDAGTMLWLDHDRAGVRAVEVELTTTCDVSSAVEVPPGPDEVGMRVFQEPTSLDPFTGSRSLVFEGGCIVSRYRFAPGSAPSLVIEADRAVSTLARSTVVAEVRRFNDLSLCGAEAPHCAG
jgi:hypothetical protein